MAEARAFVIADIPPERGYREVRMDERWSRWLKTSGTARSSKLGGEFQYSRLKSWILRVRILEEDTQRLSCELEDCSLVAVVVPFISRQIEVGWYWSGPVPRVNAV
jgi:hypothetical protein